MIKRFLLLAFAVFAMPVAASAQEQEGTHEGTWALKINDAHIWVFTLERDGEGGWDGSWLRPARFEGNGIVFVRFAGEELVEAADGSQREGVVQLRFPPTQRGGTGDVLHFSMTGEYTMTMEYLGTELEPYPLVRVVRGSGLGPFDENMIYDRDNAVTVAEYDPTDEPSEAELVVDEAVEAAEAMAADELAEEAVEPGDVLEADEAVDDDSAVEAVETEELRPSRMTEDFLDGLGEPEDAAAAAEETAEEPAETPSAADVITSLEENTRACSDLDRRNLPDPEDLDALWGADYEQLGNGLDIREYVMSDGQIARVTVLEDRIYLNRCGPA